MMNEDETSDDFRPGAAVSTEVTGFTIWTISVWIQLEALEMKQYVHGCLLIGFILETSMLFITLVIVFVPTSATID